MPDPPERPAQRSTIVRASTTYGCIPKHVPQCLPNDELDRYNGCMPNMSRSASQTTNWTTAYGPNRSHWAEKPWKRPRGPCLRTMALKQSSMPEYVPDDRQSGQSEAIRGNRDGAQTVEDARVRAWMRKAIRGHHGAIRGSQRQSGEMRSPSTCLMTGNQDSQRQSGEMRSPSTYPAGSP